MTITVGKKAPMFTLPSSQGTTEGKWALKDHLEQYVVVYFYPRDNTPGCTTEANDFKGAMSKFKRAGASIVGISKDSLASHEKFSTKYKLNFPLLSDESGKVLEKYDAWGEKNMYGKKKMGIIRSTVVIAPGGKVIEHFAKVRVKGHVDAVLEVIKAHKAS